MRGPVCEFGGCDQPATVRADLAITPMGDVHPDRVRRETRVYCAFHLDEVLAGPVDEREEA